MTRADIITLLDENADDLKAQGLPEAAGDLRRAAKALGNMPLLEGPIAPAGLGTLPARIILHQTRADEWATHLECLQETGKWARSQGHYFDSIADAAEDFAARCRRLA